MRQSDFLLYKLLNVPKTATMPEIKKSYRQLALQLHPDKNAAEDAKEKFQKIAEAYGILSNPEQRRIYDETGDVENVEQFMDAYDYYRNLYPKVTKQDIDNFETAYRNSQEEETDLIAFYNKQQGDIRRLLENIILSTNDDIPRFVSFYEQQIDNQTIKHYKAFDRTKVKVQKLKEEAEEALLEMESLQKQIQSKQKGSFDDFVKSMEDKYGKKRKAVKNDTKLQKQQKK